MAKHSVDREKFTLYACLPFIELADESVIQLGPVLFWPASKSKEILPSEYQPPFQEFIKEISQVKAFTNELGKEKKRVNTIKLDPKSMTCISLADDIPNEAREFLLIDSLYLLYFTTIFLPLYYDDEEIPQFESFRKIIPASADFIISHQNADFFINETFREECVIIKGLDKQICSGFGKALNVIYKAKDEIENVHAYRRLIRSIRYLVDRFFQRFINMLGVGIHFSKELFTPEDLIFLASSFETLFNINDKQPAADFKHKVRPLLHLKYSRPVEIFWKWVDDFYDVKRRIIYGDTISDPICKVNPNFEVSHVLIGIKLFIYAVYYHLLKLHLILSPEEVLLTPEFNSMQAEEIILFFWTEPALLRKLNMLMKESEGIANKEEILAEMEFLSSLCVTLYQRYHHLTKARFIPTPLTELGAVGNQILNKVKEVEIHDPNLFQAIHPNFTETLEKRLKEK